MSHTVSIVRSTAPQLSKSQNYLVVLQHGDSYWEIERSVNRDRSTHFEVRLTKKPVVSTMRTAPLPADALDAFVEALEARARVAAELEEQMRRRNLLRRPARLVNVAFVPYGQKVKHRRGWCSL
jgi:hypothetical protein